MFSLILGSPLDFFGPGDDPGVVDDFGFKVGDDGLSFFDLAVGDELAGGFGEPGDGGEEGEGEEKLKG